MLQCKGTLYQEWKDTSPEVWGLTAHLASCPFSLRVWYSHSPPHCNSSARAPLLCQGVGQDHGLSPALPCCQSKQRCPWDKEEGIGAEERGTGWLGWVRPPKAQTWFCRCCSITLSISSNPGSVRSRARRTAIQLCYRGIAPHSVTDKRAHSKSQLPTEWQRPLLLPQGSAGT